MLHLTDPEILRGLSRDFIPVALNVGSYKGTSEPVSRWFQEMAREAGVNGGTYQGFYAVTPGGHAGRRLLGVANQKAGAVKWAMDLARKATRAEAKGSASDVGDPPKSRWLPPPGASYVRVFYRLDPARFKQRDGALVSKAPPVGYQERTLLWIFPEEVREMVQLARRADRFRVPATLVAGLVRFKLVDLTGGRSTSFEGAGQVERADFWATVVRREGQNLRLRLSGQYRCRRPADTAIREQGPEVGVEGSLAGEMEIDQAENRVLRFRAFSSIQAWGGGVYGHTILPPGGRYTVYSAMTEIEDDYSREVHPVHFWKDTLVRRQAAVPLLPPAARALEDPGIPGGEVMPADLPIPPAPPPPAPRLEGLIPVPGSLYLRGRVTGVDLKQGRFVMAVEEVRTPDGRAAAPDVPSTRLILVPERLRPRGLEPLRPGMTVVAVGPDPGPGKPLTPRLLFRPKPDQ